jgi:prepilin-type processing-associated H-X9-DG protein
MPHLGSAGAAARVFVCPDDFVERNEPRSYSLNDRLWDPANGYNNQGAIPASYISRPTETICLSEYFIDGNTLGFPGYHTVRSPVGDAERLNFHYHNGNWMGTVLWFDGHASALRAGELRRMDAPAADHLYAEAIDWMEYRWSK